MGSPPLSILSLLLFTASVALAVARIRAAEMWQQFWQRLARLLHRGGGGSAAAPAPVAA